MSGAISGRGAAGPQGPAGPQGESATIRVGQVTAAPAAQAAVTIGNSGTASQAVFDFTFELPRGDKGDTGDTGAPGPTGPQGPAPVFTNMAATQLPAGSTPYVNAAGDGTQANPLALTFGIPAGPEGSPGVPPRFATPSAQGLSPGDQPTVSLSGSGTDMDPINMTFGIPRGADGATGATGAQGPQPVFGTPTVATLAAGADATASISGDGTAESPYILQLGIPQGSKGATGQTGPAGLGVDLTGWTRITKLSDLNSKLSSSTVAVMSFISTGATQEWSWFTHVKPKGVTYARGNGSFVLVYGSSVLILTSANKLYLGGTDVTSEWNTSIAPSSAPSHGVIMAYYHS